MIFRLIGSAILQRMQLSKIKLAGFKTFVDPTVINLTGNLIGIVGPNGCGKSNIIDAVRWVMGESTAKHLRGDAMADVIFNGSGNRKPVSQASIELTFENNPDDDRHNLPGAYAHHAEIAIKRVLSRDGQSIYYLNGTRCRRRDILDIFLGTGLGPRSYAIIEQGMISRIIEAKPDELRAMLEEAAGISRYKERRRETETRIQHSRDNLTRLDDVRQELEKQLSTLQRQAKAAERYTELRDQERHLQLQWLVLRWRDYDRRCADLDGQLTLAQQAQDQAMVALTQRQAAIETIAQQQRSVNAALQEAQAHYYAMSAEVARLEQEISHLRQLQQRQMDERLGLEAESARLREDQQREAVAQADLHASVAELSLALEQSAEVEQAATVLVQQAEVQHQQWQAAWDEHRSELYRTRNEWQLAEKQAQHLESRWQDMDRQRCRLLAERGGAELQALADEQSDLTDRVGVLVAQEAALVESLAAAKQTLETGRQDLRDHEITLRKRQDQAQEHRSRLASMRALQQAALQDSSQETAAWLQRHNLANAPRLAQCLEVNPGWEVAVEVVLGSALQGLCVDDAVALALAIQQSSGSLTLVEKAATQEQSSPENSLSQQVRGPGIGSLLAGVETAPDLAAALSRRHYLAPGGSVVTPEGVWMGQAWVRWHRPAGATRGVITREKELRELVEQVAQDEIALEVERGRSHALQATIREVEMAREALQAEANRLHRSVAEHKARLDGLIRQQQAMIQRQDQVQRQRVELQASQDQIQIELASCRQKIDQNQVKLTELAAAEDALQAGRHQDEQTLSEVRSALKSATTNRQALALKAESLRLAAASSEKQLIQLNERQAEIIRRLGALDQQINDGVLPQTRCIDQLQVAQLARGDYDSQLRGHRTTLDDFTQQLQRLQQALDVADRALQQARRGREEIHLALNEQQVRRQGLAEQLAAEEGDLPALLAELADDVTAKAREDELKKLAEQISRLGAINLAAIDDYRSQSERKIYLDEQCRDLNEALESLETAIAKMDKETRGRFQATFDQVNQGLQRLFPRLFGGGEACLELVDGDLLTAGVMIRARPMGKRNSHIHLLSGGEKALTAIALVFAIFELNPAPFCLLDEVDAPLDEANVGRFCALLSEMSSQVQLIYITHNKTTMELSSHLLGITMSEPGVSRVVAVDVAEAAQLAELKVRA